MSKTLLFLIGVTPDKIGGIERFARELAAQLAETDWKLVLCFEASPTKRVRRFFDKSAVAFEVISGQSFGIKECFQLARLILRYKPTVLVYTLNGVLRFIPWTAVFLGVRTIVYT